MSVRYDIRRRALAELDAIRDHSRKNWGAQQKRKYIGDLFASFAALSRHPERYPLVEGRADGLRRARSGAHIIIFNVTSERVEIVRILHESMDFEAQLD